MKQRAPILGMLLGLALFTLGAWDAIHTVRVRMEGQAAMAVVLRVDEYRSVGRRRRGRRTHYETVLGINGAQCTVEGDHGRRGQMIAVHHAIGHREDCVIDSPSAHRGTLILLVGGLVVLGVAFAAYRRAAR